MQRSDVSVCESTWNMCKLTHEFISLYLYHKQIYLFYTKTIIHRKFDLVYFVIMIYTQCTYNTKFMCVNILRVCVPWSILYIMHTYVKFMFILIAAVFNKRTIRLSVGTHSRVPCIIHMYHACYLLYMFCVCRTSVDISMRWNQFWKFCANAWWHIFIFLVYDVDVSCVMYD